MIENAPRDRARALRAIALRKAYRDTGDRRKLKRAKRIERQLHLGMMRRFHLGMKSVSQTLADAMPAVTRAVQRMTDAFAQLQRATTVASPADAREQKGSA